MSKWKIGAKIIQYIVKAILAVFILMWIHEEAGTATAFMIGLFMLESEVAGIWVRFQGEAIKKNSEARLRGMAQKVVIDCFRKEGLGIEVLPPETPARESEGK